MLKKYLIVGVLSSTILIGGCLNKSTTPTTPSQTTKQTAKSTATDTGEQNQVSNQLQNEFGDLTPYIKADLTTGEKEQLLQLLDKRSIIKSEIGNLESYEGDKIIKLREIKQKREELRQQLTSYIDPQKLNEFNNYCNQLWEKVKNKYTQQATQQQNIPEYSLQEVAQHNKPGEDCWTIINGAVYDITSWFDNHPGGAEALNPLCGTDGTQLFNQKHGNNVKAIAKLESFRIGIVKN